MASAAFQDRSGPGGIVHNPASPYAREMAKWEMGYSPYGPPGRPREVIGHQEYPAMFYTVRRSVSPLEVRQGPFVVVHCMEAADEHEASNLSSRGYVRGRAAAEQAVVDAEQALSVAAAISNADDRHMSDKAKAEREAFEASTIQHVAEIPQTPIREKRKYTKRVTEMPTEANATEESEPVSVVE